MLTDILVFLVVVGYVVVCPYTKVEESFNMQAIYDHIHFGTMIPSYDHLQFPGVVPRTFIGSLVVSVISYPFVQAVKGFELHGVFEQMVCRVALGFLVWCALVQFRKAIQRRFSKRAAQVAMIFTALQFHFCFYATRTLPNTYACIFTLVAFALWLQMHPIQALCVVGACAVIFRCDMIVLVGSMALVMLLSQEIPFFKTLFYGILSCAGALLLSVVVDSYFWQRWLWPEGVVLFFNTVENRSSEWGVSPFHWYFTNALPKSLHFVLLWVGIGGAWWLWTLVRGENESKARKDLQTALYFLSAAVLFISLYSVLPHKELRFIMPVLPLFTLVAAVAADHALTFCLSASKSLLPPLSFLHHGRQQASSAASRVQVPVPWLLRIVPQLTLLGSWVAMAYLAHIVLLAAQHNYPGGVALEHFLHAFVRTEAAQHLHFDPHRRVHVAQTAEPPLEPTFIHIDNLAATTGVTRFLQERFRHYTHVHNSVFSKHSLEDILTAKKTVTLPTGYAPHRYLNALPSEWPQIVHEGLRNVTAIKESAVAQQKPGEDLWFLQEDDLLVYSKHEYLLPDDKSEFDFLIVEDPREFVDSGQFVLREAIRGFERMRLTLWGPQVVLKNKLFILENTFQHRFVDEERQRESAESDSFGDEL